jgi:hypothetical protein
LLRSSKKQIKGEFMKDKVDQLNKAIREKAAELGLVFVNGPSPASFDPASVLGDVTGANGSISCTNGQQRVTYLIGLAEAV